MTTVLYVTRPGPSEVGGGGKHRSYQILYALEQTVGQSQVVLVDLQNWRQQFQKQRTILNQLVGLADRKGGHKLKLFLENPYKLMAFAPFTARHFAPPQFFAHYERTIKNISRPAVCIVDDARLARAVQINVTNGIPTIFCSHNLESFDTIELDHKQKRAIYTTATDFAKEFNVLAQCTERLFISKVETGLIGGLGLSAHYYPYLPVGALRQKLDMICRQRLKTHQEPGLFLMLGSVGHGTTREAFTWFVQNAQAYGVPEGIRVVVSGSKTDELLPAGSSVPGLELQGWLEQSDLDRLLLQARGVLAPQQRGFGALTRLPELACAGLPVITSRHPTYALDPPPGLHIADDDWPSWCQQMVQLNRNETHLSTADYKAWEENQPKPLGMVVKRLLKL